MAKHKKSNNTAANMDGLYLLKLLLYLLLGSLWVKLSNGSGVDVSFPLGLMVGLIFASHEHFQIDRKIEYAVLLAAMLFGYFAPYGLYINW